MSKTRTLVCGSIAVDTIMVFPDRFGRHILPERTHMLSVSFHIGDMRREWGGCAGNIAYNLKALGGEPVILATVGSDGDAYRARFASLGISDEGVRTIPGSFTAQAYIITDIDDNQITAFHPGAMNQSHETHLNDVAPVGLAIVGPDGREGMLSHVSELSAAGIPFVFDPGQALPLFSGDELTHMVDQADYVAVNDYEGHLLSERTGLSLPEIAGRVDALIETRGAEGSRIYADGAVIDVPTVPAKAIVDPTGCGDAYRAGLLYGIAEGWDWARTGRLASMLGSIKIASRGGQNHSVNRDELATLYYSQFRENLW
jgi:adenosine kinase